MNVLPVYFPSSSIGPPKLPPAGLTGWLTLILFYLIFTICQKAQTSLSPFLPVRKSWPFQVCVFWGDSQCGVAQQDSLQGYMSQEARYIHIWQSFPPSVFRGHWLCLELAGCPLPGPWFSHHTGLLFILASGLVAPLVCTVTWEQDVRSQPWAENCGLWVNLYTVPVEGTQTSPSIWFCLPSMGAFLPLKDANRKLHNLGNGQNCLSLPCCLQLMGKYAVVR